MPSARPLRSIRRCSIRTDCGSEFHAAVRSHSRMAASTSLGAIAGSCRRAILVTAKATCEADVDRAQQAETANLFLARHRGPPVLLLPNVWDAWSARLFVANASKPAATPPARLHPRRSRHHCRRGSLQRNSAQTPYLIAGRRCVRSSHCCHRQRMRQLPCPGAGASLPHKLVRSG